MFCLSKEPLHLPLFRNELTSCPVFAEVAIFSRVIVPFHLSWHGALILSADAMRQRTWQLNLLAYTKKGNLTNWMGPKLHNIIVAYFQSRLDYVYTNLWKCS